MLFDHFKSPERPAPLTVSETERAGGGSVGASTAIETGLAEIWSPKDVRTRLEEAGRTLMALPMPKGALPQDARSNWPDVVRGHEDIFAALVGTPESMKKENADRQNFVRVSASAADVGRMDEVLEWLWRVRDVRKRRLCLCRALIHPVSGRHIVSFRKLGRMFGLHHETMRAWHDRALAEIAVALTEEGIPKTRRRGRQQKRRDRNR